MAVSDYMLSSKYATLLVHSIDGKPLILA